MTISNLAGMGIHSDSPEFWFIAMFLIMPFWIFATWNLRQAMLRHNHLATLYWILNIGYSQFMLYVPESVSNLVHKDLYDKTKAFVTMAAISSTIGVTYGISLFVFWWLRPDFYYRWDERRRKRRTVT